MKNDKILIMVEDVGEFLPYIANLNNIEIDKYYVHNCDIVNYTLQTDTVKLYSIEVTEDQLSKLLYYIYIQQHYVPQLKERLQLAGEKCFGW